MLSHFTTDPFRHIQSIADHIRRDVENSLNRSFHTWDVLEHTLPNDKDAYYRMKIRTDDNGHVKVKTLEKEPGKSWDVNIEEYDRGKKIKSEHLKTLDAGKAQKMLKDDTLNKSPKSEKPKSLTHMSTSGSGNSARKVGNRNSARGKELATVDKTHGRQIQSFADSIKHDVESMLNETFNMFDVFEHTSSSNRQNQNYNMKIKTDNQGGHVRVNAVPKKSGKDWDVSVQEYNKGKTLQKSPKSEKASTPKKSENLVSKGDIGPNKLVSHDQELSKIDELLNHDIQSIADFIKNDVESILNETFNMFDVFEHTTTSSNEERPNYNMKIRTNDKGGNVQVNATPNMESNEGWDVNVQQYNKGKESDNLKKSPKKEEIMQSQMGGKINESSPKQMNQSKKMSTDMANKKPDELNKPNLTEKPRSPVSKSVFSGNELANFDRLLNEKMQSIADFIKNDVESILDRTFKIFDVFEHSTSSSKLGKTNYNMNINVDNGGHVKVKATPNESGKDWDVRVDEYDKGKTPEKQATRKSEEGTASTRQTNTESQRESMMTNPNSTNVQSTNAGQA